MKSNELKIMQHLRNNARESLTRMSRKTGIPVSTIYERLKQFEQGLIRKHTCLLDFRQLGYDLSITLLIKTVPSKKEDVQNYLVNHHQVNLVFKVNNGYDFLAEVLFKNMAGVQKFMEELEQRGAKSRKEFFVLEEIKREAFLTSESHMKLMEDLMS